MCPLEGTARGEAGTETLAAGRAAWGKGAAPGASPCEVMEDSAISRGQKAAFVEVAQMNCEPVAEEEAAWEGPGCGCRAVCAGARRPGPPTAARAAWDLCPVGEQENQAGKRRHITRTLHV